MDMSDIKITKLNENGEGSLHPNCGGCRNHYNDEFDCSYETTLECEDCKYGLGRKDPDAKCNQLK